MEAIPFDEVDVTLFQAKTDVRVSYETDQFIDIFVEELYDKNVYIIGFNPEIVGRIHNLLVHKALLYSFNYIYILLDIEDQSFRILLRFKDYN